MVINKVYRKLNFLENARKMRRTFDTSRHVPLSKEGQKLRLQQGGCNMVLNIQNNTLFNGLYTPFAKSLNHLQKSAERMATGQKFPNAAAGVGVLGVADRLKRKVDGTSILISGMHNAKGYTQTQDAVLQETKALLDRMTELAYSATDPLKSTSDRAVLNQEFRAIEDEIRSFDRIKYNGLSVFDDTNITLRVGTESTDTYVLQTLNFGSLTFAAMSLDTTTNAQVAVTNLETRGVSLNAMLATVGGNTRTLQANIDIGNAYIGNMQNAESSIRNIDVAIEVAKFTAAQLSVNAAQSIIGQSYGLHSASVSRLIG